MNLQDKIAKVETEIYRTVQALDWISAFIPDGAVDLDELNVSLDQIAISSKTVESLDAWAGIEGISTARHSHGNPGIYTFTVGEGEVLAYVFVRCPEFLKWDERRGVKTERDYTVFPTRSLVDDLTAFHASPVSQEVTA